MKLLPFLLFSFTIWANDFEILRDLTPKMQALEAKDTDIVSYIFPYYRDLPVNTGESMDCADVQREAVSSPLVIVGDQHSNTNSIHLLLQIMETQVRADQ